MESGRSTGVNGNGHSAAPPLFGPMVRYQSPEPPRRSVIGLILRGFAWLVLAVLVIGAGVAGGAYLYAHETLKDVSAHTGVIKKTETNGDRRRFRPRGSRRSRSSPATTTGRDRWQESYAGSNSDTLMLLRADPTNDTLSLLSFPRDLWVNIYCNGNTVQTQNRINSAWSDCSNGPAGRSTRSTQLTGLHINYLITLDFNAFMQIVDHLHGVYINVDRRYYNSLRTRACRRSTSSRATRSSTEPRRSRTSGIATSTPTSTATAASSCSSTR